MKFLDDWKGVLARAWSVRLIILAGILSGAEVTLSLVTPGLLGIHPGSFAVASGVVSMGALVARLLAQGD
jgi:hypothetical protein